MKSKKQKLETLDELVLDKMIAILTPRQDDEGKDLPLALDALGDLNTAVQYLAKNNVIAEKVRADSVEEHVAKKKAAAKKRRDEGKSE